MPDYGYKIKRFGWLKDYPSIKDFGPQEVEQRLLSELRAINGKRNSGVKSVLQADEQDLEKGPSY